MTPIRADVTTNWCYTTTASAMRIQCGTTVACVKIGGEFCVCRRLLIECEQLFGTKEWIQLPARFYARLGSDAWIQISMDCKYCDDVLGSTSFQRLMDN